MADIFSPIPASSQIFTSKSRPPFGQHQSSRHNQLTHHASTSLPTPVKVSQKRRHSDDSDDDMERGSQSPAPSPEKQPQQQAAVAASAPRLMAQARSRKLPLKKVRLDAEKQEENKNATDVADARVLLANLPLSSYPALVQALLDKDPSITKLLVSVIPRPSADAAREAIILATKKLRDAVPYSAVSSASTPLSGPGHSGHHPRGGGGNSGGSATPTGSSSALGLTSGINGATTSFGFGSLSSGSAIGLDFGFGSSSSSPSALPSFASAPSPSTSSSGSGQSGQRDAYVLSRIRPAIQDFVSTVHAYLPYFSMIPAPMSLASFQQQNKLKSEEDTNTAQLPHPDETFTVLASLTNSFISLPAKVVHALNEQSGLQERLLKEWKAWLDLLDESLNNKGDMFSGDQARCWIAALDSFAAGNTFASATGPGVSGGFGYGGFSGAGIGMVGYGWSNNNGVVAPSSAIGGWGGASSSVAQPSVSTTNNLPEMRALRDAWVEKVGWLVGRQPPALGFEAMDEL
ncbi:hypothetical protein M408DRAFT_332527 [Serendipita vermifera MAFF 305830]|uniref:Uncharacterized protein n=2 Tax=Serendipita vermifera MAFF 305830 TaxID=933852 RepID=A0A0C2X0K0_SERVB|nr:hypothetical protein M408DRAFT_332527 [Serendipita vermifera MAFF 305830]